MKKFLKFAFVAIFVAVAAYGVYASQKFETMSELALANVEALARGESPSKFLVVDRVEYTMIDEHGNQQVVIVLDCRQEHPLGYDCA